MFGFYKESGPITRKHITELCRSNAYLTPEGGSCQAVVSSESQTSPIVGHLEISTGRYVLVHDNSL